MSEDVSAFVRIKISREQFKRTASISNIAEEHTKIAYALMVMNLHMTIRLMT